uniref:Si:ch211-168b3.2 n=1 Tax=Cyprinus carpio TaxID=7962 RepID=A0A8C1YTH2_CYPCA
TLPYYYFLYFHQKQYISLINLLSSLLSATDSTGIPKDYSAWPIVLGALTAVLSVGLLIALAVRYLRGMRGRMIRSGESSDDDDGFIEDNYIQATEREEDKEEEIQQEDADSKLAFESSVANSLNM